MQDDHPNGHMEHPSKQYSVAEGHTISMSCDIPVKGKPIIWIRADGQRLPSDHKVYGRDLVRIA